MNKLSPKIAATIDGVPYNWSREKKRIFFLIRLFIRFIALGLRSRPTDRPEMRISSFGTSAGGRKCQAGV